MSDHELAAELATRAGELLLAVRAELEDAPAAERKVQGDKRSHDFLMRELGRVRPADAVLSEEGVDNPVRLRAERVWIVDPLDGTREFSEPDRDDWAVHVALWERGELVAGAVALPAQGITLATPDVAAPPEVSGPPRILVSRTRPPAAALQIVPVHGKRLVALLQIVPVVVERHRRLSKVQQARGQPRVDEYFRCAVARLVGLRRVSNRVQATAISAQKSAKKRFPGPGGTRQQPRLAGGHRQARHERGPTELHIAQGGDREAAKLPATRDWEDTGAI